MRPCAIIFVMRTVTLPALIALFVLQARPANNFVLTVDNIMRGPALVGYEPSGVRWSPDGSRILFQWKRNTDKEIAPMDTYTVNRDGGGLRKLTDEEVRQLPPASGDTTKDKRLMVYSGAGDLFTLDNNTGKITQLTKTTDAETNPRFTQDGKRISFTRGGNLYVMSLDSGLLVQLTDIRPAAVPATSAGVSSGSAAGGRGFGGGRGQVGGGRGATSDAPPEVRGTDSQEYLKKEQKELLQVVRERVDLRDEQQKKRFQDPRKPFTLLARQSVGALQLTPDEKYVIASVFDSAATPAKNTIVPNFITDSVYTEDIPGRSNVGDTQGTSRLAILNVETGEVKWVDHGQKRVPAPAPAPARTETARTETAPAGRGAPVSNDRDIQMSAPVWSEDGTKAVIGARAADNKDRWIFALDPTTGKTRVLVNIHDDAWVGGPQGAANTLGWMKNDREVYFISEKTGYAQLYAVPFDAGEPRALTNGNWEVLNVRQSRDKSKFYLIAGADGPSDQFLYEMPGDGGPLTRLSKAPGKHTAVFSPDERFIADVYSYSNKPPDLYVQENRPQQDLQRLTTSPSAEFAQYAWQDPPIVMVPARDGAKVPAHMFKPANYKKGGPAVIFVHGSGYLQNVDHKWSTYYHEYLFHHLLQERGYLVLDVDYRGSAGYGRDWRTAVYEHMGGKDLDDIVDAAKYAVAQHGADPKKIGLYGGSYGGFITLMAMFTQPDVFAAGAALRPVTDWATYNHGYTSDILNTPQADPEAYRRSSPIFFAEGLKGALLICHGMVDTNVEFQDTVRLTQRLIELHKENWSVAPYPVEDHTFVLASSWADEYKRILKLFETNLK
jgi:dipeptidyl aminopeptidase/acylaminoacyl peptidase